MSITYHSKLFPFLKEYLNFDELNNIKNNIYPEINEHITQYAFFDYLNYLLNLHRKFLKKNSFYDTFYKDTYILYRYIICSINYNIHNFNNENSYYEFMNSKQFYKKVLKKIHSLKNIFLDIIEKNDDENIKIDYQVFSEILKNVDVFIGCVFIKINIDQD